jgi:hypothetical protein
MATDSSNNLIETIISNIVPILIFLFFILSRLTRVKKTPEDKTHDTFERENAEEEEVKEEIRQLIESRRQTHDTPHTQTHTQEHSQHHIDEATFTKSTANTPVKSTQQEQPKAHTPRIQELHSHTFSYEDYTKQLAQQQKKIDEARALRSKIQKQEVITFTEAPSPTSAQTKRSLADIFANKTPLQQAILAKEILDTPIALRSSHH